MTKRLWSINSLAVELDKDRRTVATALKSARPDGGVPGHPAFYILTAIQALGLTFTPEGDIDPVQARARKDTAQAISAELANAVRQGQLCEVEEVGIQVDALCALIRERVMTIPGIVAIKLPPESVEVVEAAVRDALTALSDGADIIERFDGPAAVEQARAHGGD